MALAKLPAKPGEHRFNVQPASQMLDPDGDFDWILGIGCEFCHEEIPPEKVGDNIRDMMDSNTTKNRRYVRRELSRLMSSPTCPKNPRGHK